jgi:hypothetical protein
VHGVEQPPREQTGILVVTHLLSAGKAVHQPGEKGDDLGLDHTLEDTFATSKGVSKRRPAVPGAKRYMARRDGIASSRSRVSGANVLFGHGAEGACPGRPLAALSASAFTTRADDSARCWNTSTRRQR